MNLLSADKVANILENLKSEMVYQFLCKLSELIID